MANSDRPVIMWFRRDLRLADNPALSAAAETGRPIIPLYILDDHLEGREIGAASRWWLHGSLEALGEAIEGRGGKLILRRGHAEFQLRALIEETGADAVYMNRLFEPEAYARDTDIAHSLKDDDIEMRGFNGSLLCKPGGVMTGAGGPYKVFTPFKNTLLAKLEPRPHATGPRDLNTPKGIASDALANWQLRPTRPDWATGFLGTPGEAGASAQLSHFIAHGLQNYTIGRDHPAADASSRLSPHIHHGDIAVWRVLQRVQEANAPQAEIDKFTTELAWRDFSAHLLHHFPRMTEHAFRPEYDTMPWAHDAEGLAAWKAGRTGYPFVDAGMRELWTTGVMHNRVRMVVASFLIKHLLIDWREGERWFWDTLVDADLASNVQNWQWTAGSGADAAPYFRIYNPVSQGERFDANGDYVRKWVPEIGKLGRKWIHAPWTAPDDELARAGVRLGETYPKPIVDHGMARQRALDALKSVVSARYDTNPDD